MKQTPAHDGFNSVLLELMNRSSYAALVEVGCSRETLARVYRESHPEAGYVGIELESERVQVAGQYCSRVICWDIESLPAIRSMAAAAGADPDLAVQDSMAFQYVLKALPV